MLIVVALAIAHVIAHRKPLINLRQGVFMSRARYEFGRVTFTKRIGGRCTSANTHLRDHLLSRPNLLKDCRTNPPGRLREMKMMNKNQFIRYAVFITSLWNSTSTECAIVKLCVGTVATCSLVYSRPINYFKKYEILVACGNMIKIKLRRSVR